MTADNPIWALDADAEAHRESRINLALLRGVLENLRSNRKTIPLFALAVAVMFVSPMTKFERDIAAYAVVSFPPGRLMLAGAMELMHRIHKDFR